MDDGEAIAEHSGSGSPAGTGTRGAVVEYCQSFAAAEIAAAEIVDGRDGQAVVVGTQSPGDAGATWSLRN